MINANEKNKHGSRMTNLPNIESLLKTLGYRSHGNARYAPIHGPSIIPHEKDAINIAIPNAVFVSSQYSTINDFDIATIPMVHP